MQTALPPKYQKKIIQQRKKKKKKPEENHELTKYQDDLYAFFLKSWEVLEPSTPLQTNWHLELICEYLTLVDKGKIKKLKINIAPRHLKSRLCSVVFPPWQWLKLPSLAHLCCSYSSSLANDLSDDRRTLIQSDFYRNLFPELKLSNTKNRISEFKNNFRGEMNARGLDAGITGIGGIGHIYDDPNDPDKVETDAIRDRTLKRYKDYSVGRRNDPKNYFIIVIQQRTHENDISGYIDKEDSDFVSLSLPTVAEKDEVITFPISGKTIYRKRGDFLHPERFGEKEVAEAKKTLGRFMFASRHQQRPIPVEGGILKEKYWNYYLKAPECPFKIWAWDTAFKEKDHNDFSAGILLGVYKNNYYALDAFRDRLDYPDLRKQVKHLHEREKTNAVVIEDKASGQSLIQELKRFSDLPIVVRKAETDKVARVKAISPTVEAGRVYLPHNASWLSDFITETSHFPRAAHDDLVDAFVHGLSYLLYSYSTEIELYKGSKVKRASVNMKY